MEFDNFLTLFALLLGPLGIWMGWRLSESSEDRRYQRTAADDERRVEVERATQAIRYARNAASEFRSVAAGVHFRHKVNKDQLHDAIAVFNDAWRSLELVLTEATLLGPTWLEPSAKGVMDIGRSGMETVWRMQQSLVSSLADSELVQTQITEFDRQVDEFLVQVRQHLTVT